jgi:hypothetical protein
MKILIFTFILVLDFAILDDYGDIPESARKYIEAQEICEGAGNNRNLCFTKTSSLNIPNFQCCILDFQSKDESFKNCSLLGGSIEQINEQKNSKMTKAILREIYGFNLFKFQSDFDTKHSQKYDCQDGKAEIYYGYEEYSFADEEKLKSNKHCLRYFYSYAIDYDFKEKFPTNNDCYNADLLPTSKDAGLKCGYGEFNLKYTSGQSEVYKTCYFYDSNAIKTKTFDDESTSAFDIYAWNVGSREGDSLLSYTVEISDDSGNKLRYDSLTKQVTIPSASSSSKGIKDYKSKYLLYLLILILL